jgi:dipeptidyl aminopeptidase/acylaminoacyl peptidase
MNDIHTIPNISDVKTLSSELALTLTKKTEILDKFKPIWDSVVCYSFFYLSDGRKVKGFLVEPKIGEKIPCIIYNRGGSKDFGKIDDATVFFRMAEIASWGYVVIASQYSGNDGSEGKDECGGMDLRDVTNFKPILDMYAKADSNRIGLFGGSRGGMQTYMVLKEVDWVKAAVIKSGSTNEIRGYEQSPELREFRRDMYDVDSEVENKKRSSIFWANLLPKSTPLLLIHGTNDESVSPLDAMEMGLELYINKIPSRVLILEGDNHKLSKNSNFALQQTREWFDRFVRDGEESPIIL